MGVSKGGEEKNKCIFSIFYEKGTQCHEIQ